MMELIVLLALLVLLNIAASEWGYDSTGVTESREWEQQRPWLLA